MNHGVKYVCNDFFYLIKKHFCPDCKTLLKKVKVSRIVNSSSPEAKDFDFTSGDSWLFGDIKFIWKEFECPKCGRRITVKEMQKIENA